MKALLAVAMSFALAGCASTQETPDMPALGAAATSSTDTAAVITGSRIPAKRTEKMVSQVGGKDYKDNKSSLMAPLQSN
ncbi:hypothetical protein NX786_03075 [Telluria mixta]|jgi:uncharacterized lipoprotein YmbA|uniref:Lipoprotein n=1 Tax=Telluria mixta TaxID=34071 RepID=A0ABT2BTE1_9BURK|nr:hypothetical protein [Telluria mixta]MCS0628311.1 hypothetical protein [Telluria mixta]WEM93578.1 hypothetical protein P0M04_18920 [Telluria mixta]